MATARKMAAPSFAAPGRIPFQRIHTKDADIAALQDSVIELVHEIEQRFAAAYFQGMPIGVPFPFLAGRFAGNFQMDSRFVRCDGRRIIDSPMASPAAPVMNDPLGGAEVLTWFVRVRD